MNDVLSQLKRMTTVVADTGDFTAIEKYSPVDATTNPSLVLKTLDLAEGEGMLVEAAQWARAQSDSYPQQLLDASDYLAVQVGLKLLSQIPGRVSTEVDARLSFDTQGSIARARRLIDLYQQHGVPADRVLIKLAATWQGIRAAEALEAQGIQCNLTLLFSFAQARACAEAGVFLISPFVGRILDWYKAKGQFDGKNDPGVQSVEKIYQYFKLHDYSTIVMGASFRNVDEIIALAGCDRLTISPSLLEELASMQQGIEQKLKPVRSHKRKPQPLSESEFYWQHNLDAMAVDKLSEGIRNFASDTEKLEHLLSAKLIN